MDYNGQTGCVLEFKSDIFFHQILMNVSTELITVIPMQHVIILWEVSLVHATLVFLVME